MSYCMYCKHDVTNDGNEDACKKCSVWDESWEEEGNTTFNFEQDAKYDGVVF